MQELAIGGTFAGCRIEEIAGRGGMGIVYCARQLTLDRRIALKVIAPELAEDPGFRQRFQRESRTTASIDHPNVIPVYEAGEESGQLYIEMKYVMGTDLRQLIAREGRIDPRRAAQIVSQVAAALDAAHEHGLVHRDVKPANVLISGTPGAEHVYLTDFGLSKRVMSQASLTETGHWVGTLDYVAPEQIRGERVDARADVYALGCLLYQALTGQVPFVRDSDVATMWAHLNDEPPSLPDAPAFDALIRRALAKDPRERYPSAGDLGRAALAAASDRTVIEPERSVATGPAAPAKRETVLDVSPPAPAPPAAERGAPTPPQDEAVRERRRSDLPAPTRKRAAATAWIAAAAVIAAAGVTVALVLGGDGSPPDATTDTQRTVATTQRETRRQTERERSPVAAAVIAPGDVRRVLERYQAYYSNEDAEGIGSLLAEDVFRRNAGEPPRIGRPAVLAVYRSQFDRNETLSYRITDLSIVTGGETASATGRYAIELVNAPTARGSIAMRVARRDDQLLIDRISTQPGA